MSNTDINQYWEAALHQNAAAMKEYFTEDACIKWHNTNEAFTADEFIRANCEYPGKWEGEIERLEMMDDLIITVVHVWQAEGGVSFHVTSFIKVNQEKIISIDEYWGDDGAAPEWRQEKKIGRAIKYSPAHSAREPLS